MIKWVESGSQWCLYKVKSDLSPTEMMTSRGIVWCPLSTPDYRRISENAHSSLSKTFAISEAGENLLSVELTRSVSYCSGSHLDFTVSLSLSSYSCYVCKNKELVCSTATDVS